ncbi:hypothetical protein DFJ73DRAFT_877427 [Zopfochytrium polystomum]|nr:hypothetical protein DFJ73DRAFT_877427 [Zopfochytrium polystomum]
MDALHATLDKTAHFKRLWTLQEFALTKRKKIVLCPDDGATSTPPSPPVVLELKDIIPYPLGGAFYWYYQMVFNCTVQPLFDGQLGMWDSVGSHGGTNGYFTIHFSRGSPRQSSILKDQVYGTHKVLEIPVTQPYEVDDNVALFKEFLRGVLTHPRIECKFDEREVEAFLDVVADRSKDRQAVEMLWALFGKCSGVWMEKTVRTMAVLGVMPVEQLEPGAAPAGKRPETGGQMSF